MRRCVRFVILRVVGVQSCSLKLIFTLLNTQTAILATDDIQLAHHLVMLRQVIGVYIQCHQTLTTLAAAHTSLELQLGLTTPRLRKVCMEKILLSLKDRHSNLCPF